LRSVLITGGTIRLGLAIANRLETDGWRVLRTSHRPDAHAEILADFSTPSGADACFAQARQILDGALPDALVNNAALFVGTAEQLEAVNFEAPLKLMSLMAERSSGRGSVVNILDNAVLLPKKADESAYLQSKRRLLAETTRAAVSSAATLRVNAVAPGPVIAPSSGLHVPAGRTLLGRPTVADVAVAVAYLLTAEGTTGHVLPVDGGQSLLP